jgi:RNA polymerase sigma-70 factor (ECF subfamily)
MELAMIRPGAPPEQLAELIRQTAAGTPEGIAGLYRLYAAQLLRLSKRLTSSHQDAEDIVHDLFLGLPQAIRSFEHRGSFEGWLSRVVTRMALMRLRSAKRRREAALDERQSAPDQPSTDEQADLERHVAALPLTLRAVVLLRQIEGYSHEEIGALLGISPGASRVRFNRAVQQLRQRMTEKP